MIKKLFKHSLVYGLAPFVPKVINLLMLPIFTAVLNPLDYGVQSLLNSSMGLIGVLSMLGLGLPLTNAFYQHNFHYKKRWAQFYGFLNIWMLFYALILAIVIYFIVPKEAEQNLFLIIVLNVIPLVVFGPTSTIGQLYYQLNQEPKQVVIRTIVISVLTVFLNYVTIVLLDLHYMGWFFSTCISNLLLNASYWYPLHFKIGIKPIYNFKNKVIKSALKVSLPMIPHYYGAFLLGSADTLILKYFKVSTAQIGFYGFAATFGGMMAMVTNAVNTAAGPILFEMIRNKEYQSLKKMIWIIQGAFLITVSLGCIWTKEIFEVVIKNRDLQQTYFLAALLILGHNYRPMYFGSSSFLFYNEKTRNLWKVTLGAGIFCILANFLLIPYFGFKTPAFILVFSYLIMGYGVFFLKDYKVVSKVNFYPLMWFTFTVLSGFATLYVLKYFNVYAKLILTFLCGVALVLFFIGKKRLLFTLNK
ncbi:lipopolysaccharide biosynthesis protein [Flavobacterium sp.]|uniref:lipopolysaccharide biosynthesis protein n=1 Tax=Flavobacterium sp. TaxID=239 RepID=UPI0031D5874C